jgi:hypothetical protein
MGSKREGGPEWLGAVRAVGYVCRNTQLPYIYRVIGIKSVF